MLSREEITVIRIPRVISSRHICIQLLYLPGRYCFASFHSIGIVSGRTDRLTLCSLLSHGLQTVCRSAGEGLPFTGVHSGTVGTKIPYQMKAEGTWEKDGKIAVSTWERGGKSQ